MKMRLLSLAVVAIGCSKASGPTTPPSSWTASDLGAGRCTALNAAGQIVGVDETTPASATFIVTAGGARTPLGTFAGAPAVGVAIDAQGNVAGYSETSGVRAAVLYTGGAWTALAGVIDAWSAATGIGDQGVIVGVAGDGTIGESHGFLWSAGTVTRLPVAARSAAYAAGTGGLVTGIVETTSGATHSFLMASGKLSELPTLGGKNASAFAVDAKSNVVGSSEAADGSRRAALFTAAGGAVDLGLPAGATKSEARGIDSQGRIAGNAAFAGTPSLPYQFISGGAPVPLPLPADAQGAPWTSAHVAAMATNGAMTGWGTTAANDGFHCAYWAVSK